MVLATVYETSGSTYSKAGHRILIAANGDYQGLVSGGCLEGDVAERARRVIETGESAAVTYDMRDDADDLWGLGVGCNGLIRIFLQPLLDEHGYEPFASIAQQLMARERAAVATVIESGATDLPAGATLILRPSRNSHTDWQLGNVDDSRSRRLKDGCERALAAGRAEFRIEPETGTGVLYAPLQPVPRVLVLGAGLDAIPIVNMATDLGWLVTVADHRPAYVAREGFARAERILEIDPRSLAAQLPLGEFDAILVMSHHLVTDRTYLSQIAGVDVRYVGVLGPPARKERLLKALGEEGHALRDRLRGPVGLDIGADSPEAIALSILAELQTLFATSRETKAVPSL